MKKKALEEGAFPALRGSPGAPGENRFLVTGHPETIL
jgi:hypothetical protein